MSRILLTNFHPKGGGGHVPYIMSLIENFNGNGHVVGVVVPQESQLFRLLNDASYPYLYECDFPSISLRKLSKLPRSLLRFRTILKDFKPDIVHTNGVDLYTVLWSHPFMRSFRIIRTHHAVKPIKDSAYHRFIYGRSVARNIFVSEPSRQMCLSEGVDLPNSIVIENGIDTELYKPVEKDRALAQSLGLDDETFVFGSCAGTMPYKRVDTVLQAASRLIGTRKFAIIALGDESYGRKLEKLAEELGVKKFIYAGFHRNVIPYVSLFDVGYVLSDSVETVSFAAREMMSMGKPLISSSYSGLVENISDNVDGILVEPGNVEQISRAMELFLYMDTSSLSAFSSHAREKALERFGIVHMIRLHAKVYEDLSK